MQSNYNTLLLYCCPLYIPIAVCIVLLLTYVTPILVVVVYPLSWPLLVGGVRCSRLWSTSQLLRPSGQQCSHSGGVCPQIQGRQCGAYVGAVYSAPLSSSSMAAWLHGMFWLKFSSIRITHPCYLLCTSNN